MHLQKVREQQLPEQQRQREMQKMREVPNSEVQVEMKKQTETDLARIIKKIKNIDITDIDLPAEETKPVQRMPKKNITADTVKGKILQFKNCEEQLQDMISHAFINIWAEDFASKNITTYIGVKQFILDNFKDKLNAFFVLFDDEGDFISTFAVDVENFAPFISHIFVNPTLRNKGFGKKTIKYGEKYIKKLGFNASNLWCEEHLVPFYRKQGYVIESKIRISETKEVWKMAKNLD
jgi:GNAT superfamily N-acetyltransferase